MITAGDPAMPIKVSPLEFLSSILILFAVLFPCTHLSAQSLTHYLQSAAPARILERLSDEPAPSIGLRFVSHSWQGQEWKHVLRVYAPKVLKFPDTALLLVTGSRDPKKYNSQLQKIADESGAYAAGLGSIPNQPLFDGLTEDRLLAYTFEKYRQTGDPSWPVLMPMVTSVVRALDVLEGELKEKHKISSLRAVIAGASKRGWTTWLTPTVDKRVVAIAPAVFDMLDIPAQVSHAREAYGQDSPKIRAYTALGLTDKLLQPRMAELMRMIDPVQSVSQISVPKLVLLGANDPYWVADSFSLYEKQLVGPTNVAMLPNVGHGVLGTEIGEETLLRWFSLVAAKLPFPDVTWAITMSDPSATLLMSTSYPIHSALLWEADSDDLDFRLSSWSSKPISVTDGAQKISAEVKRPRYGRRGVFGEVQVMTNVGPLRLTSPITLLQPRANRPSPIE
jgi:PhoPQ-activated pathogenicity-related protein